MRKVNESPRPLVGFSSWTGKLCVWLLYNIYPYAVTVVVPGCTGFGRQPNKCVHKQRTASLTFEFIFFSLTQHRRTRSPPWWLFCVPVDTCHVCILLYVESTEYIHARERLESVFRDDDVVLLVYSRWLIECTSINKKREEGVCCCTSWPSFYPKGIILYIGIIIRLIRRFSRPTPTHKIPLSPDMGVSCTMTLTCK